MKTCDECKAPATFMLGHRTTAIDDGVNVYACDEHLPVVVREYSKYFDPCAIDTLEEG